MEKMKSWKKHYSNRVLYPMRWAGCVRLLVGLFCSFQALAAQNGTTAILLSGDPAQGGRLERFGQVSINERGDVAFNSLMSGTSAGGVFLLTKQGLSAIALAGDPGPNGGIIEGAYKPMVSNRGDVLFTATIEGAEMQNALCLYSHGSLSLVAHDGQVVESKFTLTGILDHALSNSGEIAFISATYEKGLGNTAGVFRRRNGEVLHIAAGGEKDSEGNAIKGPTEVSINDSGEITFLDYERVTPGGRATGHAVFRVANNDVSTLVFGSNRDLGDDAGRPSHSPFLGIRSSNLNRFGKIAVVSGVEGPIASQHRGLLILSASSRELEQPPISQTSGQERLVGFKNMAINDAGRVVFLAASNEEAAEQSQVLGVLQQGRLEVLHRQGENVPGLTGVSFKKFRSVAINNAHEIAFTADLSGGGPQAGLFIIQ